jgi:hypothetical protein
MLPIGKPPFPVGKQRNSDMRPAQNQENVTFPQKAI